MLQSETASQSATAFGDLLAAVRQSALGVGFLSGGYGQEELERSGAFRVHSNAADLLAHIEQL
jgi:phosphoglycolate phosphatase-like HAD superfamily hydrolase